MRLISDRAGDKMNIIEYTLDVGVEAPFSVIHMSDNHICLADERDDDRKNQLCEKRRNHFTDGCPERQEQINDEMFSYVRESGLPLIHTGDFIDFVSHKALDCAKEYFSEIETVFSAGNHEFSLYVGEAWEDEDYKKQSFEKVQNAFSDGIEYGVRRINGLKFITIDDGYYYILPEHIEQFKTEISDGEPFVLVLHNPLYSENLYKQVMENQQPDEPPYLTGCPEKLLTKLSEHRFKQQRADETTLEFLKICNECENLKAVLSGHLHKGFVSELDSGVPQLVADGAFHDIMYKINFK